MNRNYLTNYLTDQGCYAEEDSMTEAGEWWINSINSEGCNIPNDEEIELTTYCHIFYELRVDPPVEGGYDSDYHVYCMWRENELKLNE